MADRCERDGTHMTKDRVDVLRDGDVQRLEQLGEGEVHLLPRLLGLSSAKLGLEVAEVDEHLLCARLVSRTGWSLLDDDICDNVGLLHALPAVLEGDPLRILATAAQARGVGDALLVAAAVDDQGDRRNTRRRLLRKDDGCGRVTNFSRVWPEFPPLVVPEEAELGQRDDGRGALWTSMGRGCLVATERSSSRGSIGAVMREVVMRSLWHAERCGGAAGAASARAGASWAVAVERCRDRITYEKRTGEVMIGGAALLDALCAPMIASTSFVTRRLIAASLILAW